MVGVPGKIRAKSIALQVGHSSETNCHKFQYLKTPRSVKNDDF